MKIILSVIAVCLVMITVKLYTPDLEANQTHKHGVMDIYDFEYQLEKMVRNIVNNRCSTDGEDIYC